MSNVCRPTQKQSRKGSGLLEGALVLFLAVSTLLAVLDFGQVLFFHQALVERVRVGARWGVVNTYDDQKIRNVVVYDTPNPTQGAAGLFGLTTALVSTSLRDSGTPEARLVITISGYPFRFFTPLIVGGYTAKTISATVPLEEI